MDIQQLNVKATINKDAVVCADWSDDEDEFFSSKEEFDDEEPAGYVEETGEIIVWVGFDQTSKAKV